MVITTIDPGRVLNLENAVEIIDTGPDHLSQSKSHRQTPLPPNRADVTHVIHQIICLGHARATSKDNRQTRPRQAKDTGATFVIPQIIGLVNAQRTLIRRQRMSMFSKRLMEISLLGKGYHLASLKRTSKGIQRR